MRTTCMLISRSLELQLYIPACIHKHVAMPPAIFVVVFFIGGLIYSLQNKHLLHVMPALCTTNAEIPMCVVMVTVRDTLNALASGMRASILNDS